ncbi:MAG TPA: TonB-dependent receptor [Gemmatimonadales bacterium]
MGWRTATRHYGVETGLETRGSRWSGRLAYTFARYRYLRDSVVAGNDIPGAPRHAIAAELSYRHPSGFSITPSVEWVPQAYFVNSANSAQNDPWAVLGVRAEWDGPAGVRLFVAAQNLTDARYSPSAQVDNVAGRSYEPGDGRTFYGGITWHP